MLQQNVLEDDFRSLLLPQCLLHFALSQLKSRTVRCPSLRSRRQNLARFRQLAHPNQDVGLALRHLVVKNALRIAIGKSVQNILRSGIVAGCMAGLGVKKIYVVAQFSIGAASLRQRCFSLGIAIVQEICVAQRQVRRRRRLARVAVRIGRHAGISRRRAQRGKLLRHGLQFF